MADQEQLALLAQGPRAWNEWRQRNPDARVDLPGADLSGANIVLADLTNANLSSADLTAKVLKKASHNKDADVPDVRADEPDRAMAHFTIGLRRVLSVSKPTTQKLGDTETS